MALVLFALGVVPMANYVAEGHGLEWWGPSVRLWIVWGVLVVAIALLLARTVPAACDAVAPRAERWLLRAPSALFAGLVATVTTLLGVFFAWRLFRMEPVTMDELSVQWQARLLAGGRLFAAAEPHPEFFGTMQTLQVGGRWLTHFPIGEPALLSVGMLAGAPWLVNPVLAGLSSVVLYRFVRRVSGELEGRLVALLFALSPFVLFMAASQLDHVAELLAVWIALAALPAWLESRTASEARRAAAVIGVAMGMAASIRPYDAALMGIVIAVFQLAACRGNALLARSLAIQIIAGAIPVALLLGVNATVTGHPLTFAYDVLNGAEHRPGFHLDPFGVPHTPRRGIYNVSAYLMRLDVTLLGWPVPALALVVAALAWQKRATRWDHLLLGALAALLIGYWAYWGEGRSLGPRFLFTIVPVFFVYVARFVGLASSHSLNPTIRRAATVMVPLWLAAAWLTPALPAQPFGVWTLARRAQERDSATALVTQAIAERGITNAVVFVNDGWHARLAARLRALGARPFMAQRIVGRYDACMLQQLLDSAEHTPALAGNATSFVFGELDRAVTAQPIPGLSALEQLALTPGRPLPARCAEEFEHARSNGVDLARFLPLERLDAAGRLAGPVVYARDYGPRDSLLRERFGGREWYTARVDRVGGALSVVIQMRLALVADSVSR